MDLHGSYPHPYPRILEKHSRATFIAKLPALKSLNGGTASPVQPFLYQTDSDVTITPIL